MYRFNVLVLSITAGIDYQPFIRNITLSQSIASVTIQVETIENNVTDGNRKFGLRIIIPEETQRLGIELGTPSELNITIIDDDGNIRIITVVIVLIGYPFICSWRFGGSMLYK